MAKIFYIIEKCLVDSIEIEEWKQALKKNNVGFKIINRVPFTENIQEAFPDGFPVECYITSDYIPIYYCTIEMCKLLVDHNQKNPELNLQGLFYSEYSGISCLSWFRWLYNKVPLVNTGIFTSYNDLISDWYRIFKMFDSKDLFIKPDKGDKLFAGSIWNINEKQEFLNHVQYELQNAYRQNEDMNEVMVMINRPKNISAEYRFFILDGKVVTGSQYRRNNILDKRIDVSKKALDLANEVAKLENQISRFYACDIVELQDGSVEVLEINAGSCSGLYEHNKDKLVKAFKEAFKNLVYKEIDVESLPTIPNYGKILYKIKNLTANYCSNQMQYEMRLKELESLGYDIENIAFFIRDS